jgi:predicted transcriptional regulator
MKFVFEGREYDLSDLELKILKYHKIMGPDYSKLISHRFHISLQEAFDIHKKLLSMGLLQKVTAPIINYHSKDKRLKSLKHRNHTYYDLSRTGKLLLREYERQVKEIELELEFPYKR